MSIRGLGATTLDDNDAAGGGGGGGNVKMAEFQKINRIGMVPKPDKTFPTDDNIVVNCNHPFF